MTLYIICGFLLLNTLTFTVFGLDKRAAKNGGWRVSEGMLLTLALLGGTPAAYAARTYFRHKTSKQSFTVRLWLVTLLQLCAIAYMIASNHL